MRTCATNVTERGAGGYTGPGYILAIHGPLDSSATQTRVTENEHTGLKWPQQITLKLCLDRMYKKVHVQYHCNALR